MMRYTAVNPDTDTPFQLKPGTQPPDNVRFAYYPRITCKDCPGRVYNPGPGTTVEKFEVHLKNRNHRAAVEKRIGQGDEEADVQ